MFTGIVTAIGTVGRVERLALGADAVAGALRLEIAAPAGFLEGARRGDSVAVDGVCQTIVELAERSFTVEAIGTTLARTTLGEMEAGRSVNLELALALGERLGGHLVQGHVDGTGQVLAVERQAEHVLLDVSLPADVAEVTVPHGSITIDGVSLTVNALPAAGRAQVALIPYTWDNTNLRRLHVGAAVNVEGDMLGRFVVHYLKIRSGAEAGPSSRD